jgi:hypothetical protein
MKSHEGKPGSIERPGRCFSSLTTFNLREDPNAANTTIISLDVPHISVWIDDDFLSHFRDCLVVSAGDVHAPYGGTGSSVLEH